ncbi:uncharacterized protein LOC107265336 [Cephus cinctus]|uniref:Uncharacterized protein LOC107265336 n=1 Tax=Cephus cinctus TaxID=211228 RepID=A0AAJ7FG55_CEPCN|nr:uncharacterized protein LOC107265336 [Cephus cinctus]
MRTDKTARVLSPIFGKGGMRLYLLKHVVENMALSAKREGLKHVPWFSLQEWLQVYNQIYSNDTVEQDKGYKTLLVWKARVPKLPVGIECTLGLIQVCLRDRELTLRIDNDEVPVLYENDLCLMYSTMIMRFLNHISNIGNTKQISLFQIARQLKIPEWIVNLRHDTAHGHDLPSLSSLRLAANMLLTWLHDEYWASEAKNMEEYLMKQMEDTEDEEVESEEAEALKDLIELWVAIGLYMRANYSLVEEIPDSHLQNALQDLRKFTLILSAGKTYNSPSVAAFKQGDSRDLKSTTSDVDEETVLNNTDIKSDKKFQLSTARGILLTEMSRYLGKNKSISNKEERVLKVLLETEVFLPQEDFLEIFSNGKSSDKSSEDDLPLDMIYFWQDFILLLQETKMLESTILRLLKLLNDSTEDHYRKQMAALWIKAIVRGLLKMKVSQHISETLQYSLKKKKRISTKSMSLRIRNKLNHLHPELKNDLTLNILGDIPNCVTNFDFVTNLVLNANEYSAKFITVFLDLVTPSIEQDRKQLLLDLIKIYIGEDIVNGDASTTDKDRIYTIEDFEKYSAEENHPEDMEVEEISEQAERRPKIFDQTIRNTNWKLASHNYDWGSCPIGILPWQLDTMESLPPMTAVTPVKEIKLPVTDRESKIVPGIIDMSILKMRSNVSWDGIFRKKRRIKRKRRTEETDVIINKAIEIVKKHH